MAKLRRQLFNSMNEIKTRGIKLTTRELKKFGIYKIVNIAGTPEYMVEHNIGCVIPSCPGKPFVTEKSVGHNGLIIVSIIFFRQILYAERYMLKNHEIFKPFLLSYLN